MAHQDPRYARARKILLAVFLISSLLSVVLISLPRSQDSAGAGTLSTGMLVVTTASCITSATTFAGFAAITALLWRRDRRESQAADIELRKARLELEKLERMREEEVPGSDLEALRRRLDRERHNLLLIEERRSQYVMETAVPLELVKQEQDTRERIGGLEKRIQELERSASGGLE